MRCVSFDLCIYEQVYVPSLTLQKARIYPDKFDIIRQRKHSRTYTNAYLRNDLLFRRL